MIYVFSTYDVLALLFIGLILGAALVVVGVFALVIAISRQAQGAAQPVEMSALQARGAANDPFYRAAAPLAAFPTHAELADAALQDELSTFQSHGPGPTPPGAPKIAPARSCGFCARVRRQLKKFLPTRPKP